jgi:xanthine/uracil permease
VADPTGSSWVPAVSSILGTPASSSYAFNAGAVQLTTTASFADDTAAAAGGIPLFGLYRNGGDMKVRIV